MYFKGYSYAMSQSRKKIRSTSNKSGKSNSQSSNSDEVLNKLDGLRSNIKHEHNKIAPTVKSNRNQIIALVIIVVLGTSGLLVIYNPGGVLPLSTSKGNQNKNIIDSVDGFQQDTLAPVLFDNGKLDFLYIGGQFCPYCAMQRWAIVMALEHFGTFSGLSYITSAEASVPTYDFIGVTYSSNNISFAGVEVWNNVSPNYSALETLNSQQQSLYNKYGTGSIPFIIIGGSVFRSAAGASLNVNSFSGQTANAVQYQISQKSGPLYEQINTESSYLIQIISQLLASKTATTSTAVNTTST